MENQTELQLREATELTRRKRNLRAGIGMAAFLAALLLKWLLGAPSAVWGLLLLFAFLYTFISIAVIPCPKCGKKFFFRRFLLFIELVLPIASRCMHCRHPLKPLPQ